MNKLLQKIGSKSAGVGETGEASETDRADLRRFHASKKNQKCLTCREALAASDAVSPAVVIQTFTGEEDIMSVSTKCATAAFLAPEEDDNSSDGDSKSDINSGGERDTGLPSLVSNPSDGYFYSVLDWVRCWDKDSWSFDRVVMERYHWLRAAHRVH